MRKFVSRILGFIACAYHFFWHVVMQRDEPYTRQLCRMEEAYPFPFWSAFTLLNGVCWYHFLDSPTVFEAALCLGLIITGVWLIGHLIDYIQAHPDNTPDPPECN